MSRILSALVLICHLALSGSPAGAQQLSMDDFVPPAQGGATQVKGKVSEEQGLVKSGNAQDGLNYAYQRLMDEGEEGVRNIAVPSGQAMISVAYGYYNIYNNRNATLLSKRAAYLKAMLKAQKAMVENMSGSISVCKRAARDELLTVDSGSDENQTNSSETIEERCKEKVRGMVRGYVLFSVEDRPEEKTVVVALASSTKTRGAVKQLGGAIIQTSDPKKAWQAVVSQITNGVIPPIGARLITNPETGEHIVIGFGSAIVRKNRNSRVAAKLAKVAKKQARIRSRNALVSFLKGDKVYWAGKFEEKQLESDQQFEVVGPGETVSGDAEIKAYDKSRQVYLNALYSSDDYRSITAGRVPPGVKSKVFLDKTGDWAVAVAVYAKTWERAARRTAAENGGYADSGSDGTSGTKRTMKLEGGLSDSADNPQGPSGKVSRESDL